jgi:hypothetical protein
MIASLITTCWRTSWKLIRMKPTISSVASRCTVRLKTGRPGTRRGQKMIASNRPLMASISSQT